MNVDVTAENRPACPERQHHTSVTPLQTHEYQGRVQIFLMFLHKILVVLFGLLAVVFVEFSTKILLDPPCVAPRAVRYFSMGRER